MSSVDQGVLGDVMLVFAERGGSVVMFRGRLKNALLRGETANVTRMSTARVRIVALWRKRRRG